MKKRVIIGICIAFIWVLALTITYFFATRPMTSQKEKDPPLEKMGTGVTMYDTYNQNGLRIQKIEINENMNYLQISGLKNKEIENNINAQLKAFYEETKALVEKQKNPEECFLFSREEANFNDVLSIQSYGSCYDEYGEPIFDHYRYFNISLKDGKEISFEDLFTDKTVINSLLTQALTYTISLQEEENSIYYDEEGNQQHSDEKEKVNIEDEVWKLIQNLDKKNISFFFDTKGILLEIGSYDVHLPIDKYGEYFAYPTKYRSKDSLYIEDIGFKNISYVTQANPLLYYQVGYQNDNLFVDTIFTTDGSEMEWEEKQKINQLFQFEDIQKEFLKQVDTNQFQYFNVTGEVSKNTDFSTYYLGYLNTQICSMDKQYFEKEAKKVRYQQNLDNVDGLNFLTYYDEDKNIRCTKKEEKGILITTDGRRIDQVEDIFQKGYDYETVILNSFYRETEGNVELAKELMKNVTYEFNETGIRAISGDYSTFVSFENFGKENLSF